MRRYFVVLSLIVLCPHPSWTQTPVATADLVNAPRVYIPVTDFDFGEVREGSPIRYEFKIYNKGKSVLKISSARYLTDWSFGLLDSKHQNFYKGKIEIPPGGLMFVEAGGPSRPGPGSQIITVNTNDPLRPKVELKMEYTVITDVDVDPLKVYFYGVQLNEGRTSTIKVLGRPGFHLKVLSADSIEKVVDITSIQPVTQVLNSYRAPTGEINSKGKKVFGSIIEINLPATRPAGKFTDEILLKTNNVNKPEIGIPVLGEVIGKGASK
jgi:hypothetical protein